MQRAREPTSSTSRRGFPRRNEASQTADGEYFIVRSVSRSPVFNHSTNPGFVPRPRELLIQHSDGRRREVPGQSQDGPRSTSERARAGGREGRREGSGSGLSLLGHESFDQRDTSDCLSQRQNMWLKVLAAACGNAIFTRSWKVKQEVHCGGRVAVLSKLLLKRGLDAAASNQ